MYNKNMSDSTPTLTSQRIRQRRLELGLSQRDLGKRMGVGNNTVSRWETGVRGGMSPEVIRKLAEILRCDANYLSGTDAKTGSEVKDTLFKIVERMTEIEQSELLRYCLAKYPERCGGAEE